MYEHECPHWDGLEIDATMHEFAYCLCFDDSEAIAIQSRLMAEIDKERDEVLPF